MLCFMHRRILYAYDFMTACKNVKYMYISIFLKKGCFQKDNAAQSSWNLVLNNNYPIVSGCGCIVELKSVIKSAIPPYPNTAIPLLYLPPPSPLVDAMLTFCQNIIEIISQLNNSTTDTLHEFSKSMYKNKQSIM